MVTWLKRPIGHTHADAALDLDIDGRRIVLVEPSQRLDKSVGGFSPTTRYRDYAISPELIHWESQSATASDSATGQRYIRQREDGTNVVLFARLRTTDRAFWCLGPASYVSHEGDRPIAFVWKLHRRLPAELYTSFAAAVA